MKTVCGLCVLWKCFFLPDAQMDDQDLNEPIAKVALLKGKQKFIFVILDS